MRTGYSVALLTMSVGLGLAPLERWRAPAIEASARLMTSKAGPLRLAVRIDGATTPESIPDELAYRHFIKTVITSASASAKEFAIRDAVLVSVGLSETDRKRVIAAVDGVKDHLQEIEAARQSTPPLDRAKLSSLRTERIALLDVAAVNVLSSLQPDARGRLERFIQVHVKKHIVVYGDPMMAVH